jgi:hypothetical protein
MTIAGMGDIGAVTVVPLATGMAFTLALMALKAKRPPSARSRCPKTMLHQTIPPYLTLFSLNFRKVICPQVSSLEALTTTAKMPINLQLSF